MGFLDSIGSGIKSAVGTVSDFVGDKVKDFRNTDFTFNPTKGSENKKKDLNVLNNQVSRGEVKNNLTDFQKQSVKEASKLGGLDKLESTFGSIRKVGEGLVDSVKSTLTGEKSLSEIDQEFGGVHQANNDEAVKLVTADLQRQINNNLITVDEANSKADSEIQKMTNELDNKYLLDNNVDTRVTLTNKDFERLDDKSLASIFLHRNEIGLVTEDNGYNLYLDRINKKIKEDNKKNFSFDKNNLQLSKRIDRFAMIEDTLNSNQATIEASLAESLVGVPKGSDNEKRIIEKFNQIKDAKQQLGFNQFKFFKELALKPENFDKSDDELQSLAFKKSIDSLSIENKAALKQQDELSSGAALFSSLGNISRKKGELSEAQGFEENAKALGSLGFSIGGGIVNAVSGGFGRAVDVSLTPDNFIDVTKYSDMIGRENNKIISDNYEYDILGKSALSKGFYHLTYNLDDIFEAVASVELNRGAGFIGKGLSGANRVIFNKGLKFLEKSKDGNDFVKFSIGLSKTPFVRGSAKLTNNIINNRVTKDIKEGIFANAVIDRSTLQASSEANTLLNAIYDGAGGRVFSGIGFAAGTGFKNIKSTSVGIFEGKEFRETVTDIVNETGITRVEASTLLKGYKNTLASLSKPLVDGNDFLKNFKNVAKDLEINGEVATDFGNIVKLDNIINRYRNIDGAKTKDYFEGGIATASEFDTRVVIAARKKALDNVIDAINNSGRTRGKKDGILLKKLDNETVDKNVKLLEKFKDELDQLSIPGSINKEGLLAAHINQKQYIEDFITANSLVEPKVSLYNTATNKIYTVPLSEVNKIGQEGSKLPEGKYVTAPNVIDTKKKQRIFNRTLDGKKVSSYTEADLRKILDPIFDIETINIADIKSSGKKLSLKEIYDLGLDKDSFFSIVRGSIDGKEKSYLVPGKKLADNLLLGNLNPYEGAYTTDIINIAFQLGLDSNNVIEPLLKAIDLVNSTSGLSKPHKIDFDEMFNKTVNKFSDKKFITEGKLTEVGEKFKTVISQLYEKFRIEDSGDAYILKSLIVKLSKDEKTFSDLMTVLNNSDKKVGDIKNISKIFLGSESLNKLYGEIGEKVYKINIEKEMDDIIRLDVERFTNKIDDLDKDIVDINNRIRNNFSKDLTLYYTNKLKGLQNKKKFLQEKISRLESGEFRDSLIENAAKRDLSKFIDDKLVDILTDIKSITEKGKGIVKETKVERDKSFPNESKIVKRQEEFQKISGEDPTNIPREGGAEIGLIDKGDKQIISNEINKENKGITLSELKKQTNRQEDVKQEKQITLKSKGVTPNEIKKENKGISLSELKKQTEAEAKGEDPSKVIKKRKLTPIEKEMNQTVGTQTDISRKLSMVKLLIEDKELRSLIRKIDNKMSIKLIREEASKLDWSVNADLKLDILRQAMHGNNYGINLNVIDEQLTLDIVDSIESGIYTDKQVATENPVTNIINGIVTLNKHFEKFASERISKELGFSEGLQKAFVDGDSKANDFLDGFIVKNTGDFKKDIETREKFLRNFLVKMKDVIYENRTKLKDKGGRTKSIVVKVDGKKLSPKKSVDYLFDKMSNDDKQKIYKKFYSVANSKKYGDSIIEFKKFIIKNNKGKNNKGKDFIYYKLDKEIKVRSGLFHIDQMINTMGKNIKFLGVGSIDAIKKFKLNIDSDSLKIFVGDDTSNAAKILEYKLYNSSLILKDLVDYKLNKDIYKVNSDYFRFIKDEINNGTPLGMDLRKNFGLKDNEIIAGSFGDKDSFIRVYSNSKVDYKDLEEVFAIEYKLKNGFIDNNSITYNEFEKLYKKNKGDIESINKQLKENGKNLGIDSLKTNKREPSFLSDAETFRGLDTKHTIKIIKKYKDEDFDDIQLSKQDMESGVDIDSIYEQLKIIDTDIDNSIIKEKYIDPIKNSTNRKDEIKLRKYLGEYLNKTYPDDLDDGFSAVGEGLAISRNRVNGNEKKHTMNPFKDHFIDTINGIKVFGKTLFNPYKITDTLGKKKEGIYIGENSLKMGDDGFNKVSKKEVIDGEVQNIIMEGKEKVSSKGFKSAASDSFKSKDKIVLPLQILNKLGYKYKTQIENFFKKTVDTEFESLFKTMGTEGSIDLLSTSINDNLERAIISKANIGYTSDSAIDSTLNKFINTVKRLVSKTDVSGQATLIKKSRRQINGVRVVNGELQNIKVADIGRKEILISKDNRLVKEQITKQEDEYLLAGNPDLENFVLQDIYVSSFRNPVPNVNNVGVYKLKFIEDIYDDVKKLNGSKKLGDEGYIQFSNNKGEHGLRLTDEETIVHPETTYVKIEGDHDGDHMQIIPVDSYMGDIVTKGILGINFKAFDKDGVRAIDLLRKGENYKNDITIVRGDKQSGEASLIDANINSVEAKESISLVMGTVRTLDIIKQLHQGWVDDILTKTDEALLRNMSLKFGSNKPDIDFIFSKFGLNKNSIIDKNKYEQITSQIAQDTLDFANSGKLKFSKDWMIDLLGTFGDGASKLLKDDFGKEQLIEIVSDQTKGFKIEDNKLVKILGNISDKQLPSLDKVVFRYMNSKYGDFIKGIRTQTSRKFVYDEFVGPLVRGGRKKSDITFGKNNGKEVGLGSEFEKLGLKFPSGDKKKLFHVIPFIEKNIDKLYNVIDIDNLNKTINNLIETINSKGTVLNESVRPLILKRINDRLNKLFDEGLDRGDIIDDQFIIDNFFKLGKQDKGLIMFKLLVGGHNRFLKLLTEKEKLKKLIVNEDNIGVVRENFSKFQKNFKVKGIDLERPDIETTIVVDMGDKNSIELAKQNFDNRVNESKKTILEFVNNNKGMADMLDKIEGKNLTERVDNLLEKISKECS